MNARAPRDCGALKLSTKPKGFADKGDAACCAHSLAGDARTLAGREVFFPRYTPPEKTDYIDFSPCEAKNSARLFLVLTFVYGLRAPRDCGALRFPRAFPRRSFMETEEKNAKMPVSTLLFPRGHETAS